MLGKVKEFLKIKSLEDLLFYTIILGVTLISFGVWSIATNFPNGKYVLILGSGIFYISIVVFTFVVK